MTPENFVYWLQGYSEVTGGKYPTRREWLIVQDHLKHVFNKTTPLRPRTVQGHAFDVGTPPQIQKETIIIPTKLC